jgi:hypothetical protein
MNIPSEIHNIILSYLNDFTDVRAFEIILNTNNIGVKWLYLVSVKYPNKYFTNIIQFNPKEIYYALLRSIRDDINISYILLEYLLLNKSIINPLFEEITLHDNIRIFENYVNTLPNKVFLPQNIKHLIINNKINIINYYFNHGLIRNSQDNSNWISVLLGIEYTKINIEIITTLLNSLEFRYYQIIQILYKLPTNDIFDIFYNRMDFFHYLDDASTLIPHKNLLSNISNFYRFKKLFDKFRPYYNDEVINRIKSNLHISMTPDFYEFTDFINSYNSFRK